MSGVFGALAATLGLIFLWGVFAPRSQWRVLTAWSVTDAFRNEPGGAAYGVRRAINGVGVLGLLGVVVVTFALSLTGTPAQAPPPTPVEKMWAAPDPMVVNRIVTNLAVPPTGLVEMPILGYQDISAEVPRYFDRLRDFALLGTSDIPGLVGTLPEVGNRALFYATIVVHVRGPLLCVPRAVRVNESGEAVQIGVFYGLPDGVAGSGDLAVDCAPGGAVTGSVLIPLRLGAPVGERSVQTLEGAAIGAVAVPRD
ncbi:MAG: hypothetical protein ABL886_14245 [Rhodoglobus sp.]